jgi:hypothetical protein
MDGEQRTRKNFILLAITSIAAAIGIEIHVRGFSAARVDRNS